MKLYKNIKMFILKDENYSKAINSLKSYSDF